MRRNARTTTLALVANPFMAMLLAGAVAGHAGEQPARLSAPMTVAQPAEGHPQYFAHAAWSAGAKCWLVVWQDGDPTLDGTGKGPAQNILAARVSVGGKVMDAKPIVVCAARGAQQRPRVASDGGNFLIVWHDLRGGKDWDLYAARVTGDGKVLDKDGELLFGGAHNQCFADVVFGNGNYYVAWLDMRNFPEYRVYGSRIAPDTGKALDGQGVEIVRLLTDEQVEKWRTAPFSPGYNGRGTFNFIRQPGPPTVAADGKSFLVTSLDQVGGKYTPGDCFLRAVDTGTGQPKGAASAMNTMPKVRKSVARLAWQRLSAVATKDRFLLGLGHIECSFGSGPGVFWNTAQCSLDGVPSEENWDVPAFAGQAPGKKGQWRPTFSDVRAADNIPPGYRSFGVRPIVTGLAWDGRRGFMVSERFNHSAATPGDMDVLGFFIDAEGRRLSDPAAGTAVGPDLYNAPKPSQIDRLRVAPIRLADGPATQACPCVASGPEGSFLVVWQEEDADTDSRIVARVVGVK